MNLAEQLYLLAYDPQKQRLTARSNLGQRLRAAALTDLYLRGLLADEKGRPQLPGTAVTEDPLLDGLLRDIAESRPRPWKHWVNTRQRQAAASVRDALAAAGTLQVEHRRVLGLFPATRVVVRDHRLAKDLIRRTSRTMLGDTPVQHLDPRDAALAALAATAALRTVAGGKQRRHHRKRIRQLVERSGPAVPALRKALQDAEASYAAG